MRLKRREAAWERKGVAIAGAVAGMLACRALTRAFARRSRPSEALGADRPPLEGADAQVERGVVGREVHAPRVSAALIASSREGQRRLDDPKLPPPGIH